MQATSTILKFSDSHIKKYKNNLLQLILFYLVYPKYYDFMYYSYKSIHEIFCIVFVCVLLPSKASCVFHT